MVGVGEQNRSCLGWKSGPTQHVAPTRFSETRNARLGRWRELNPFGIGANGLWNEVPGNGAIKEASWATMQATMKTLRDGAGARAPGRPRQAGRSPQTGQRTKATGHRSGRARQGLTIEKRRLVMEVGVYIVRRESSLLLFSIFRIIQLLRALRISGPPPANVLLGPVTQAAARGSRRSAGGPQGIKTG